MDFMQSKLLTITILTPIFSLFTGAGVLLIPFLLLVACNIVDYATGLMASPFRGQKVNSYKSFRGITKKVCMWLLVVVGMILDAVLISYTDMLSIAMPGVFIITCLVIAWLIVNECISVIENMVDIGVDMPPFLLPVVKHIKSQVENKANQSIDKESE